MKKKKNYIYIGIIFLVTCIILSCLFINDRYKGHDTIFHVSNIIRLSKNISFNNIFGSDILKYEVDNFSYGFFGYGIGIFYPRIPHLMASYIYLLFDDIYLSMKIVYFVTTLLSGIFTYFLADKIYKNKNIALIASIIYMVVPYHVCEMYIRDAFAENFMFLVLPMIFLGLYNLKDGNYTKFYILFSLGYIIGVNSHFLSMLFYTFFVGLFIIYYYKHFFQKDKFLALVKSTLLVSIIVLPTVVPILEHKSLGIYRAFSPSYAYVDDIYILKFKDLYMQKGVYDDIMPYFNISSIVLFVLTTIGLFISKKDKNREDKKLFLIIIFILINLVCSNVLWDNMPSMFLSIQFPWRLMVLFSLVMALYAPGILSDNKLNSLFKKKNNKLLKYIFASCFVGLCVSIICEGYGNIKYYSKSEVSPETAMESILGLGHSREYFPRLNLSFTFIASSYFPERSYSIQSNKDILIDVISDKFPNMEFKVSNIEDVAIIELPRTFYLGYTLVDENNEKINLYCNNGLLTATIKNNGVYKLSYNKTQAARILEMIRTVTMFLMSFVLVVKLVKWKRKRLQY